MLNANKIKAELESCKVQLNDTMQKYTDLLAFLTPELRELHDVRSLIVEENKEFAVKVQENNEAIAHLENEIKTKNNRILDQTKQLESLRNDILVAQDTIELESFALYEPRFSFVTSEAYSDKLKLIREEQKLLIRNDEAAIGSTSWTVNNSAAQGKQLVKSMIKLCLRSFNNECDAAVAAVKFNNYDRSEQRIKKSAEAIKKLGKIMSVSISPRYLNLKIQELQLALEYQQKKQEEKEALKELRAQEREAVRLEKEIQEARKASYKEQKHYTNALKTIENQLSNCKNDEDRIELDKKKTEILDKLSEIEKQLQQIDYREANQRAGYVYVISNIGSFGEGVYKIGMTRRLEPLDRIDELGDASVPFNFDVHAMIFSDNAPALESALHNAFKDKKVNMVNQRREFFRVSLDEIKRVIRENHDKTVEFIDVPEAEQYRESIKLTKIASTD